MLSSIGLATLQASLRAWREDLATRDYSVFSVSDIVVRQGVVTHIESVEPFATGIKMKSRDQRANLY